MTAFSEKNRTPKISTVRPSIRLAAIIVFLVVLEGGARIIEVFQENFLSLPIISSFLQNNLRLDPYEKPSADRAHHWVLKAGFSATLKDLSENKRVAGKTLGAAVLLDEINKGSAGLEAQDVLQINDDGFKGGKIDKSHSRVRILTIGDSTTFGFGSRGYPRDIERSLAGNGISAEVINGGVEGYTTRNVLFELDRYLKLNPEIVTIYIGWNSLFAHDPFGNWFVRNIRTVHFFSEVFRIIERTRMTPVEYAMKEYKRVLRPDQNSVELNRLDKYEITYMWRLEKIVTAFNAIGTRVVLVTLPGLFTMDEEPSSLSLEKGHLPEFTDNPFVFAKLTAGYNNSLKKLALEKGVTVIDLAKWSSKTLIPREKYFSDSVHMTSEGLNLVGSFMAKQLEEMVEDTSIGHQSADSPKKMSQNRPSLAINLQ